MDKLKKRLDDLELIQNNIKLLNELLSHYRPESSEHEKQLIQVCLLAYGDNYLTLSQCRMASFHDCHAINKKGTVFHDQ